MTMQSNHAQTDHAQTDHVQADQPQTDQPRTDQPQAAEAASDGGHPFDELAAAVRGWVVDRGGENDVALPWNFALRHDPAVTVIAADTADVTKAVRFAVEHDLAVGVQSTGHGPVLPVDGMLILTGAMSTVTIDPERRTATIGAGATWNQVLAPAQQHGLAPLLGSAGTVGAIGYTLGGGLGWLARHFGPACDAVRSFEVVTGSGDVVRADATQNVDLFTALRGGGGGALGIVTSMEMDLFPVTDVYAGNLIYPAEAAPEIVDAWARWVADAPEELTSSVVFMNFPPLPDVPEPLRGQSFTIVRGCWSGDLAAGRELLDGWRLAHPPLIDVWSTMPFTEAASISNDPVDPMPSSAGGGWMRRPDREIAATIAAGSFPSEGPPPVVLTEIRHLGGAVSKGSALTSMGHRDREFLLNCVVLADPAPAPGTPARPAPALTALLDALGDAVDADTYLNFAEGEGRRRGIGTDPRAAAALRGAVRFDVDGRFRFGVDHRAAVQPGDTATA